MGLFVDTTGTNVDVPELGITIVHPTTDRQLDDQFSAEELAAATSLTTAIQAGTLVWKKTAAGAAETPADYDPDYTEMEELAEGQNDLTTQAVRRLGTSTVEVVDRLECQNLLAGKSFRTNFQELTAVASTTDQLTSTASHLVRVTGPAVSGYIVRLPDATNLTQGRQFQIFNDSSSQFSVQDAAGGSILAFINPGSRVECFLNVAGTLAGVWRIIVTSSSPFQGTAPIIAQYNGNANTGRYLEWFAGIASDSAPFIIINNSTLVGITLGTTATSDGILGIFDTNDLVTPILSVDLAGSNRASLTGLAIQVAAGVELAARVTSNSINKPFMALYIAGG